MPTLGTAIRVGRHDADWATGWVVVPLGAADGVALVLPVRLADSAADVAGVDAGAPAVDLSAAAAPRDVADPLVEELLAAVVGAVDDAGADVALTDASPLDELGAAMLVEESTAPRDEDDPHAARADPRIAAVTAAAERR